VIAFVMRDGATLADAEDATQFAYLQALSHMRRPGAWSKIRKLSMDGLSAVEIAAELMPGGGRPTPKDIQRVCDQLKRARSFIKNYLADRESW
jgi:hypothetical protein